MEEPELFLFNREIDRMSVNFEILEKYHPLAKIEHDLLKSNEQNSIQEIYISDIDPEANICWSTLKSTITNLMKRESKVLNMLDIGNMLYIISLYVKLENPVQTESFTIYHKEFEKTVSLLAKIEANLQDTSRLYFQINIKGENISNFGKHIEIREEDFIQDVLVMLKSKYINRLIILKDNYLAHTEGLFYNPIEMYMDVALAIALNKPIVRLYTVSYKHIERILNWKKKKPKKKVYKHKDEFLRRLYKTLLEYLTNEVKQNDGKSNSYSENCRIVHIICSACSLVKQRSDEQKQYESVKDVVKNFELDERFKLAT